VGRSGSRGGGVSHRRVAAAAQTSAPTTDPLAAAARNAHLAIVLVEPQICENIGAAARAMRNFGVKPSSDPGGTDGSPHLRLVRPRDGCPPPQLSRDVACGGADLVNACGCYDSLEQALADRHVIYAATARSRRQGPPVLSSRGEFAADFVRRCAAVAVAAGAAAREAGTEQQQQQARVALVFGRESSGLTNEEVGRAHAVVEVDSCAEYGVLNLGAAVGVLAYELWGVRKERDEGRMMAEAAVASESSNHTNPAAESRQVDGLLARLYGSLERGGFFVEATKRPSVERSLAGLLRRVDRLGERDLALLHGALTALDKGEGRRQS
jgi:tRNA/rRNA methyltransferase